LVSGEPAEFVVQARDGFTKELHYAACRNPGAPFRAALEGPYGVVPNSHEFDKIVLVAGGSGITFTLALALDWARRRRGPEDKSSLDFIWTVRNKTSFDWFENELAELHARSRVNVLLHVSGERAAYESDSSSSLDVRCSDDEEKVDEEKRDVEKMMDGHKKAKGHGKNSASTSSSLTIRYDIGRPDVAGAVRSAVLGLTTEDRVLVAGESQK
jgi:predicted ferric reductase